MIYHNKPYIIHLTLAPPSQATDMRLRAFAANNGPTAASATTPTTTPIAAAMRGESVDGHTPPRRVGWKGPVVSVNGPATAAAVSSSASRLNLSKNGGSPSNSQV